MGPSTLEISQGEVFTGIVSKAYLAEETDECVMSNDPNFKFA